MSTIARATIKSYDATNHSATVQIAGSLAVWMDAVPVSDGIAPADVIAGRECGVIFFTDDNPTDAAIITIHNAVPAGWPGATKHLIQDADANTYVDVEQSPNEDAVRMAVGGTLRYLLQTVSPHHTLTGDAYVTGTLAVTPTSTPPIADYQAVVVNNAPGVNKYAGFGAYIGTSEGLAASNFIGVVGKAFLNVASAGASQSIYGLDFQAGVAGLGSGAQTIGTMACIRGTLAASSSTGVTVTNAYGLDLNVNAYLASITNTGTLYGVRMRGSSTTKVGTVRGVQIDAWSGSTTASNPFYDAGFASTRDADGNRFRTNTQFGSVTGAFGTGDGVIGLTYATTNPSTNPAGGVVIYASAATGDFYVRGAAGQICKLPTGGAVNVTGARGGNAALASLLTALAGLGLIVDGTT